MRTTPLCGGETVHRSGMKRAQFPMRNVDIPWSHALMSFYRVRAVSLGLVRHFDRPFCCEVNVQKPTHPNVMPIAQIGALFQT